MPTVSQNFINRIRKLTKPSNSAQALQPLFEAVSNGFFAIDDLNESKEITLRKRGLIKINVENLDDPDKLRISISDDGIGLDGKRFDAFCTMDTDFKRQRGGKGVGRLFWLDAFKKVEVLSGYVPEGTTTFNRKEPLLSKSVSSSSRFQTQSKLLKTRTPKRRCHGKALSSLSMG